MKTYVVRIKDDNGVTRELIITCHSLHHDSTNIFADTAMIETGGTVVGIIHDILPIQQTGK